MALERKPERKKRPVALSFRFSEEGAERLRVLSDVLNQTQVDVIESLLAVEYAEAKKKYPKEVEKAEKRKR